MAELFDGEPLQGLADFSLNQKKLGFLGKGGSGKSTTIALLSEAFVQLGFTVCVIDADSTNMGLSKALGFDAEPKPLIEYFGGMVFSGGAVTCPVDDPRSLEGSDIDLDEIPEAFFVSRNDSLYLFNAGKIAADGVGAGCDGPIGKIARDLRIRSKTRPVTTLVDFKAGFEDSARGIVTGLDLALVMVDPSTTGIEMAFSMKEAIDALRNGKPPATKHLEKPEWVALANRVFEESHLQQVFFLLTNVPDDETEGYLRCKLGERLITPIGVFPHDPQIFACWLKGKKIDSIRGLGQAIRIVHRLGQSVGTNV